MFVEWGEGVCSVGKRCLLCGEEVSIVWERYVC